MPGMRITFVNDCGFVGGAGVALRRQVQVLLDGGHDVEVICWLDHPAPDPLPLRGRSATGRFLGVSRHPEIHRDAGLDDMAIAKAVLDLVAARKPDAVVFGNLHWASWPLMIIPHVRDAGFATIAYMHDCHWATGRCAYFGDCRSYRTGCDANCPTPGEYPQLEPELIAGAYAERRSVFTGEDRVPIATNSAWLTKVADDAFHGRAAITTTQLGLDENLFRPQPRTWLRQFLDLPQDALIGIVGAVNLAEERKGGPMLRAVLDRLEREGRVQVIGFGHNSEYVAGVRGFGNISDERVMPLLFGAADFMINCAREEAFGQTLMEAAACGLPLVTTDVGGVGEVACSNENAILVPYGDVDAMADGIGKLASDGTMRQNFGRRSREIVLERFSVQAHAARLERLIGQQVAGQ
jgi:glycosyltransferase involved in cell wall biosynthesis